MNIITFLSSILNIEKGIGKSRKCQSRDAGQGRRRLLPDSSVGAGKNNWNYPKKRKWGRFAFIRR